MPIPRLISVNEWKKISINIKEIDLKETIETQLRRVYQSVTLPEKLDALIELYQSAKNNLKIKECAELKESVIAIMTFLLNVDMKKNPLMTLEQTIEAKIEQRKAVRDFDPSYIPWKRPNTKFKKTNSEPFNNLLKHSGNEPYAFLKELDKESTVKKEEKERYFKSYSAALDILNVEYQDQIGEDSEVIKYIDKIEKEEYRVIASQRKLFKLKTLGQGDFQTLSFAPFNTSQLMIKSKDDVSEKDFSGIGIYVVDMNGSIFVGSSIHAKRLNILEKTVLGKSAYIHPSYAYETKPFMAGQISAGDFVELIDAGSGHYKPKAERNRIAVEFFQEIGIITNFTKTSVFTEKYEEKRQNKLEHEINEFIKKYSHLTKDERDILMSDSFIQLQFDINNSYERWLSMSSTIAIGPIGSPSPAKLKIDEAMKNFSNFANAKEPNESLYYIDQTLSAIDDWREFHKTKTSRRLPIVNTLEIQLEKFKFEFLLYDYIQNLSPTSPLLKKFLSHDITAKKLFEELNESKMDSHKPSRVFGFFDSSSDLKDSEIHQERENIEKLKNLINAYPNLFSSEKKEVNVIDALETIKSANLELTKSLNSLYYSLNQHV